MGRNDRLVKSTFILSLGVFLPKLASFITLPILTAYLTQVEYGSYDLITVLVSLLLPSVTLQIQTAAFRFLIDARKDESRQKEIITNIFALIVPTSIVALVIFFFVATMIEPLIRLLVCVYFFIDMLVIAWRQVARGLAHNLFYSISAIVSVVANMLLVILTVWLLRGGLTGTILALTISAFISLIYLSVSLKVWKYLDLSLFNTKTLKEMVGYSWPMVPNEMSLWVMRMSDRFVITIFMGVAANAVYAVANKIPSIINLAQGAFTLAWQENAAVVSKDEDASKYYSSMFRTMMNLQAGFLGIVIGITPILFEILIRGDYEESYNQIPILCLAIFYSSMATFLGGIYVAYKRSKDVGITTMLAAVINIVVDLSLIQKIGLYAASGSTLVSYIALLIYRMIDVKKIVNIKYDMKNIAIVNVLVVALACLSMYRTPVGYIITAISGTVIFIALNRDLITTLVRKIFKNSF